MSFPNDRVYSQSHEWHKVEGDELVLGLSQFAVDQLTDVTYVEVKPVGTVFEAGESIGEVESVKTTSDVYCAASGEIVEINSKVVDDPSLLNSDPHGEGWLAKIKITDKAGLDNCVDAETYERDHAH
ncbi:MAG: glycine cleavage system protein GcvH [Phycisphaerales bacterium]|nr:MAG: glycine cleavage system protein GcvH [Phycisphaerales bacterium]